MSSIYILLPLALLLGLGGLGVMIWALKNGQFDDLEGPAHRILFDDDKEMLPFDAQQGPDKASGEKGPPLPPGNDKAQKNAD